MEVMEHCLECVVAKWGNLSFKFKLSFNGPARGPLSFFLFVTVPKTENLTKVIHSAPCSLGPGLPL